MDWFNIVAGICSIIGLIISVISLCVVSEMRINIKGDSTIVKGKNSTVIHNYNNLVDSELFLRYINAVNDLQKGVASEQDENIVSEGLTFKVENDAGEEIECTVLFTFEAEETGRNYIVYTDNTIDKEGRTEIYASMYNPNQDETKLLPIETDEEWSVIETLLKELAADEE